MVSVVLGTYNRLKFLKIALQSIRFELQDISHEIIVIDGGSTDGSLRWLLHQKDVVLIVQHNRGKWKGQEMTRRSWGYFMNLGFKCAQGKYICMLSDDCLVVPGAIKNGLACFDKHLLQGDKVGALAFYWRNWPEKGPYFVGLTFGEKVFVNHGIYLKQALEDVGYVDEVTYSFYHADGDLCLKMWQKGYSCLVSPDSFVEHYSHANLDIRMANVEAARNDWENYLNKWKGIFSVTEGCLELEYSDGLNTAELFRQAESYGFKLKKMGNSLFKTAYNGLRCVHH